MAFFLYSMDESSKCFTREAKLAGRHALWGKGGSVARCAGPKVPNGGKWRITDLELLRDLVPRIQASSADPSGFAILDDLVPTRPQIIIGRVREILGYLRDEYNPILIVMEEVLHLSAADVDRHKAGGVQAEDLKRRIQIPTKPPSIIRTTNYLWHSWTPPRAFGGALLWPEHWDYFRQHLE